jgi:hypothetical protein
MALAFRSLPIQGPKKFHYHCPALPMAFIMDTVLLAGSAEEHSCQGVEGITYQDLVMLLLVNHFSPGAVGAATEIISCLIFDMLLCLKILCKFSLEKNEYYSSTITGVPFL